MANEQTLQLLGTDPHTVDLNCFGHDEQHPGGPHKSGERISFRACLLEEVLTGFGIRSRPIAGENNWPLEQFVVHVRISTVDGGDRSSVPEYVA
jgi:hypothetical protein